MRPCLLLTVAVAALVGCGPAGPAATNLERRSAGPSQPDRTLVLVARGQPETLADKVPLRSTGLRLTTTPRVFNASLALIDGRDVAHPYLVESLPRLGTEDWKVLPDGRMETRYALRANLTWHDGAPLTADDFVFAHRVYSQPEFGHAALPPFRQIQEVVAADERTLVIRWAELFANAARLDSEDFPPLPRRLLEAAFRDDAPQAFVHEPYWTTGYVAAGPYRLQRWEPGAFIEARSFDGHALGAPRITRLRIQLTTARTACWPCSAGFTSTRIGNPENRWVGGNRSGWSNPEYDGTFEAFNRTLDSDERNRQMAAMARLVSELVPTISLYFQPRLIAHVATLGGPAPLSPNSEVSWNIHEWQWLE